MKIKMKVKKNDIVYVRAGDDKGKIGKILSVDLKKSRVIVEGVNIATMHKKPSQKHEGGRVYEPKSIHVSNVAHVEDGKPVRVQYVFEDGKKFLVSKSSGKKVRV